MKTDHAAAARLSAVVVAVVLLAVGAGVAAGQTAPGESAAAAPVLAPYGTTAGFAPILFATHSGSRTPAQAFAIEAAGGVAGSLVGFGLVYLVDDDDCS